MPKPRPGNNRAKGKMAGKAESKPERRIAALERRKMGQPYRDIARALGVSVKTAFMDVQEALAELGPIEAELAEDVRGLEMERLDIATACAFGRVKAGDLDAIGPLVRVMERRAKLLGLDKPTKQEITGKDGAALLTFAELAKKAAE